MASRSLNEVLHLLRDHQRGQSLTDFADDLGVSKQYLSNVLNGNSPPSDRLLENFGYERAIVYRLIPKPQKEKKMSTTAVVNPAKIGCAHCPAEFDTDADLITHASKAHADKLKRAPSGKKTLTLVNVILDKSGSMSTKVADVIGGFNTYIDELKKDDVSDYLFTLSLFDTAFSERYLAEPLAQIKPLDTRSYQPGGSTALNDAIGRTITLVTNDNHKADKIITVIMTDGEENASHEYSTEAVRALIQAKEKEGWAFIFLGASLDAFQQGAALGIQAANTARYDPSNYRDTYRVASHATASASAGTAPMTSCFAATPDSMLRSANLHVNKTPPLTHDPGSVVVTGTGASGGAGHIPHSSPPQPHQHKKGWNVQKNK